nr:SPOR domain-containing protein [uncultured Kingella sp.]
MDNQPENNDSNNSQDVLAGYEQLKNQNRRRLIGAGAIAVLAGGLFAAVAGNGPKDNIEPKMANPQPQETATEILRPGGVASEAVAETHSLPPLPDSPQQNASVGETAQRQPESRPVPVQAAPVRPAEDEGTSEAERRRIRREQQRLEQQQREEAARKRAEARKARQQERLKAEQERIAKARADEQQRRQAQAIVAKAEAERAAEAKAAAERAARQKAAADEARKAERAKLMAQQKAADKAVPAKTEQAKDKPQNAKSAGRERRAVVQAGAFRDPNAAKQAQQKIKSLNYAAAIIEEVSTDKGKIYRVKTGVFPSRAEADAAAAKLKANGLGGIVLEQK